MSNFNFNKVILAGRITNDLQLRQTNSGIPVVSFRLAVNRRTSRGMDQITDFFDVSAWRGSANMMVTHLKKGSAVTVVGHLTTGYTTDKEGNKRKNLEINTEEVYFVDSKSELPEDVGELLSDAVEENLSAENDFPF